MDRDEEKLAFRRSLRRASTDAEHLLWRALKAKRLAGVKFRRQHPTGPYVLDFYCPAARLAIEADGGQHFTREGELRDRARTEFLAAHEITVIRFTDREILLHADEVVNAIWLAVTAADRG